MHYYFAAAGLVFRSFDLLNIVIPMAGYGSRFANAGFELPKPLIPVHQVPMVKLVIENITPNEPHRFIFVCQQEHSSRYRIENLLKEWAPNCEIIFIKEVTAGAACTVLLAENLIDNDCELMIANSDQWVDIDINEYLAAQRRCPLDGIIMTMEASDPKWSYVGFDEAGKVTSVVEKQVISSEATVGIYNFKKGSLFCSAARSMIRQKKTVDGEFYVAPAYNELIASGSEIGVFNIGALGEGMHGLGTPTDLAQFLTTDASKRAAQSSL